MLILSFLTGSNSTSVATGDPCDAQVGDRSGQRMRSGTASEGRERPTGRRTAAARRAAVTPLLALTHKADDDMDAPDLSSLLLHFGQKISRIEDLIPWARTCNLLVQQQDARLSGDEDPVADSTQLPDLRLLSDMILDIQESINEIDDQLDMERERMEKQKIRIQNLVSDLNSHLDYMSSNFPLHFGKSPEKPKNTKYGINATARKPAVQAAKAGPTGRAGNAVTRPVTKSAVTGRTGKAPAAVRSNGVSNNQKAPDRVTKPEPAARKSVAAPAVLGGPAVVGSKSSKPAIPVRMTKKFMTMFNHNVNKN